MDGMDELELDATELADMALALHQEPTVDQTLVKILEYAVHATACDDAGIMLLYGRGRVETPASTDSRVAKADQLQTELNEGPCLDAMWRRDFFIVHDTAADPRWPEWGPRVAALGLRSILSIRLATSEETLGALNLYSRQEAAFDEDDVDVADIFARHASVALASAREQDGLRQAIGARHLIGQAQGILMERYGLDADRAFDVLRRYSRNNNVKLKVVADRIIATGRLPDES